MEENQVNNTENAGGVPAKKNQTLLIGAVVVVLILIGFVLLRNANQEEVAMEVHDDSMMEGMPESPQAPLEPSGSAMEEDTMAPGEVKTVAVEGGNFYFKPNEIRVKKGEKVKIVFSGQGMPHDFVVDELGVRTPIVQSGNTATLEFTADKAGTFEYYCSVGQHRKNGMVGKLIVE